MFIQIHLEILPFTNNFDNLDLILQDEFRARLNEENSLVLDSIDTSLVFKRETANSLDIISGPDEDLDHLLFKTVDAQLKVSSSNDNQTTNIEQQQRIQLTHDSTEFGDFSQHV